MRHIDTVADLIETLTKATGKPHMAITCTDVGFVRAVALGDLPLSARRELGKTGQAILEFKNFTEAGLFFWDLQQAIDLVPGYEGDVTFQLAQHRTPLRIHTTSALAAVDAKPYQAANAA